MNLIVQLTFEQHEPALDAKRTESSTPVKRDRLCIGRVDSEIDLKQAGHRSGTSYRMRQQLTANALSAGTGSDIHPPDERFVRQFLDPLALQAQHADKA